MLETKRAILLLMFLYTVAAHMALYDHVVKMEQVILSVEYNQRHLNVWKESIHGYNRFYVTPLCILQSASVNCTRDMYSKNHRHILSFEVKIWDLLAAETVQLGLTQKNIEAKTTDILPLPMLMVRLGISQDAMDKIEVGKEWRSNQDQPNMISFELYTRHEDFCETMENDAKSDPKNFLSRTKLFLEFTMVVGKQASRSLNITGQTVVNSKFFSNLENRHKNNRGIVYLGSSDMNKLARDIYRTASVQDNVTSTYVPSEQENQIISELVDVIKSQTVHSSDLTTDDWNSVFWDDIFSRPDVQTKYFNTVLKYDKGEKHFKYDTTEDAGFRENIYNKNIREKHTTESGGFEFSFGKIGFGANEAESEKTISDDENKSDVAKDSKNGLSIKLDITSGEAVNSKSDNEKTNDGEKDPEDTSGDSSGDTSGDTSGLKLEARYSDSDKRKSENENTNDVIKITKNTMKLDDLQKHLKKDNINVQWTGEKFTPKDLLLYRLNTKSLKTSGIVLYKRIVTTTLESAQKIEIRPQPPFQENGDNTVSPLYFKELSEQISLVKQHLHNTTNSLQMRLETLEKNFTKLIFKAVEEITNTTNKLTSDMAKTNQHITNVANDVNGKRDTLQNEYNILRNDHNVLRNDHNAVRHDHNVLRHDHNVLRNEHNVLRNDQNVLRGEFNRNHYGRIQ